MGSTRLEEATKFIKVTQFLSKWKSGESSRSGMLFVIRLGNVQLMKTLFLIGLIDPFYMMCRILWTVTPIWNIPKIIMVHIFLGRSRSKSRPSKSDTSHRMSRSNQSKTTFSSIGPSQPGLQPTFPLWEDSPDFHLDKNPVIFMILVASNMVKPISHAASFVKARSTLAAKSYRYSWVYQFQFYLHLQNWWFMGLSISQLWIDSNRQCQALTSILFMLIFSCIMQGFRVGSVQLGLAGYL